MAASPAPACSVSWPRYRRTAAWTPAAVSSTWAPASAGAHVVLKHGLSGLPDVRLVHGSARRVQHP